MPTILFSKYSFNKNTQISFPMNPLQIIRLLVPITAISAFGFNPRDHKTKSIPSMVEPSRSCRRSLEKMAQYPKLEARFLYLQAAVGDPKIESTRFFERPFMGGSLFTSSPKDYGYEVKTLSLSAEPNLQKQSFDLIKCDLEGAEWDFLIHYSSLLKNSKFLVMEWHSWHSTAVVVSHRLKKNCLI